MRRQIYRHRRHATSMEFVCRFVRLIIPAASPRLRANYSPERPKILRPFRPYSHPRSGYFFSFLSLLWRTYSQSRAAIKSTFPHSAHVLHTSTRQNISSPRPAKYTTSMKQNTSNYEYEYTYTSICVSYRVSTLKSQLDFHSFALHHSSRYTRIIIFPRLVLHRD